MVGLAELPVFLHRQLRHVPEVYDFRIAKYHLICAACKKQHKSPNLIPP